MNTIAHDAPQGLETESLADTAGRLCEARRGGRTIPAATLRAPGDLDTAFAVQAQAFAALFGGGDDAGTRAPPVGGWKVATGPQGLPVAAPLHPIVEGKQGAFAWQDGTRVEVELAFRLAVDLPPRPGRAYRRDELLAAVDSVHIGVEIVTSRLEEGSGAPFLLFLADGLGNGGYVVGERFDGVLSRDTAIDDLVVRADGQTLFKGAARHLDGDPLTPLLAYANAQSDRLGGLKAGQIVTTGSLCGALRLPETRHVVVTVEGRESARLAFHGDESIP